MEEGLTTIKGMAEGIKPIREKAAAANDIVYKRVTELDAVRAEATRTAQREAPQVQDTIHTATRKKKQTMKLVRCGVVCESGNK